MVHYKSYKKKVRRGVPIKYTHNWKYTGHWKETKTSPNKWRISFRATKGKKARSYGSFNKGFKVAWNIKAKQYAIKTGKGTYQTHLIGTKTRIKNKKY